MAGPGSGGHVLAALCSFFIPGVGQLLQGRLGMAIVHFVLAGLLWFFFLGWLMQMVSYLNCTTGKVSHSVKDHTWSARPAAIAGVRCCHPPAVWRTRRVRTGQQKLYAYIVK